MTSKSGYYITRTLIAVAFGSLLVLARLPWWSALLVTASVLGFFLWAPRGGRYVVDAKGGIAPMRRDERTKAISDQAARNAFVCTMLALAGATVYFDFITPSDVPVAILSLVLALGMLSYFASDFWLRRL